MSMEQLSWGTFEFLLEEAQYKSVPFSAGERHKSLTKATAVNAGRRAGRQEESR